LTELLATAPLEPADCARVLEGAAAGVDALTRQRLVARNLTPERVLVDPRLGGILMDLGIPPELMRPLPLERDPDLAFRSPEELRGQPVDLRSSVYSLGVVLFTALTGDPPYSGAPIEIYSRHLEGAPPRPSERRLALSPEFDTVVARAMARDPADRYPDAGALCRAAKAAADLAPVPVDHEPNELRPKPARKPVPAPPKPAPVEVRQVPHPAKVPPTPHLPDPRPASEPAHRRGRGASVRRTAAPAAADPTADAKRRGVAPASRRARAAKKTQRAPRRNPPATSLATFITDAAHRRTPAWLRRSAAPAGTSTVAIGATQPRTLAANSKLVLAAVVAIVVCGLSGIALGRVLKPGGDPSSITRSGLTVKLPAGWEPARISPGGPALSSAIAAMPSGETNAGLVAGKLTSQAAGERMFEEVQQAGGARTQVRLGGLLGWRYAGLRPGRRLVGTGFLVPTTDGAVMMLCHASKDEARVRLAECARAATTMVVSGERLPDRPSVDRSRKRLIRVIAELRSSRSEGRERLAAADLAHGQIRAATSLRVSHQRAARSVEEISLENGHSLEDVASALRATAAAYGRLAGAAAAGSFSAHQEASRSVRRDEEALRRELVRVSAP
jgi:hypothetical protein